MSLKVILPFGVPMFVICCAILLKYWDRFKKPPKQQRSHHKIEKVPETVITICPDKMSSDNQNEAKEKMAKAIFISANCWFSVFDLLSPRQLGFGIAMISHRFDFYVDLFYISQMPHQKRKNIYCENYAKEFLHIKKSRRGEEFALCIVCNDDINLLSIGKAAISQHQNTGKHQKAAKAANRSIPLQEFLPNTSAPSTEDRKILAAEGAWAYHTAQHSHSFNSVDCVSSSGLLRTISEMEKFRSKIEFRKRERFFGADLGLAKVDQHARNSLEEQFLVFYTTVLDYLDKWFRVDRFPEKLRWVSLMSDKIPHNDALDLARQIAPDLTNNLFDDVSEANQILNSIPKDELQKLNTEQKWMKLFEADLPHLYKLVSIVLSVPVSNAFVERVFSLCGSQWTDVRNSLKVETVKALVQTKINFDLTCPEMYQMLISNHKLLDQIGGWDKYFE